MDQKKSREDSPKQGIGSQSLADARDNKTKVKSLRIGRMLKFGVRS
jgi:hypothetical protein